LPIKDVQSQGVGGLSIAECGQRREEVFCRFGRTKGRKCSAKNKIFRKLWCVRTDKREREVETVWTGLVGDGSILCVRPLFLNFYLQITSIKHEG